MLLQIVRCFLMSGLGFQLFYIRFDRFKVFVNFKSFSGNSDRTQIVLSFVRLSSKL